MQKPGEDDPDLYLQNSIFVANLCHYLNNPELACALYSLFRPFGALRSIKASRDPAGRPFGFIEFYEADDCKQALAQNLMLQLGGRPLRMERARRQLKITLKYTGEGTMEQKKRLESVVATQHRMSIVQDPGGLSAIVRVDKTAMAKELFQKLAKLFTEEQGWRVSWMNGDETGASSIRSSGLVHLVFPPEDVSPMLHAAPSPLLVASSPLLPSLLPVSRQSPEAFYNHKVQNPQLTR